MPPLHTKLFVETQSYPGEMGMQGVGSCGDRYAALADDALSPIMVVKPLTAALKHAGFAV